MYLVTRSSPLCRPNEQIKKPSTTTKAIKPTMVTGLPQTLWLNASSTCWVDNPLNLPDAVERKYWIIHPPTVV